MVLRSEILVNKNVLPTQEQALPGRETPMNLPETHFVNGNPLLGPFMDDVGFAIFGLGCFWGAERKFWQRDGVVSTVVDLKTTGVVAAVAIAVVGGVAALNARKFDAGRRL